MSYWINNVDADIVVTNSSGTVMTGYTIEIGDYTKTSDNVAYRTYKITGLPQGTYNITVTNKSNGVTYSDDATDICKFISTLSNGSVVYDDPFKLTFDIWIKNIFQSTKSSSETDAEYVERMWNDVVLDDASVSFSSGALSSADYNFLIPKEWQKNIHYDTSKSISSVDGNTYQSHWRLTLNKSTEDERSNIAYVPYSMQNAKAGDYFYFTSIQLPHFYTTYAESVVDDYIRATLTDSAQINPTWILTSDPIAMTTKSDDAGILLEQLNTGTMITVQDHRFIEASEQLHVSTLNLTYSRDSILPTVTLSLTDEITPQISSSDMLSAEIEALSAKIGSAINAQDVMGIGDARYLMKTGQDQKTLSKTEFDTTISSTDARQGSVAGSGWLIYTDSKGKKVIETDNLVVRNEMQVNSLVINQISVQGGKEILCAAEIECTRVDDDDTGYICYFDQKQGSVGNLFQEGDVAYSTVFNTDNSTLKYYKRMVVVVDANSITLSKDDDFVNGSGIPAVGDVICHYGNYTDTDRQYVIVRDVIGGGNERMISGLNSVSTDGYEYKFVGVETGQAPREQFGDEQRGGYRAVLGSDGNVTFDIWADTLNVKSPTGTYENLTELIDSATAEYIYTIIATNDQDDLPELTNSATVDKYIPDGWYDNMQSVTAALPYQFRATRTKTDGAWGDFGDVILNNSMGIDGKSAVPLYALSTSQPSTPSAASGIVSPWSKTVPQKASVAYTMVSGGSWSVSGGWYKSPSPSDSSYTEIKITITATVATTVRIFAHVSSETNYDKLYVGRLNSIATSSPVITISGDGVSDDALYVVPAGTSYINCRYATDNSNLLYDNAGYIAVSTSPEVWVSMTEFDGVNYSYSTPYISGGSPAPGLPGANGQDGQTGPIGPAGASFSEEDIIATKNDLAQKLGYSSFAEMTEYYNDNKTVVTINGKLNVNLIDAEAVFTAYLAAVDATFTNVTIKGSVRSAFVTPSIAADSDTNLAKYDNILGYSYTSGVNTLGLQWNTSQSGRTMTISTYTGTSSATIGTQVAPSGYYYFDDGVKTEHLLIGTNELVTIKGIGTSTTFYGWAVINRTWMIDPSRSRGKGLNILGSGVYSEVAVSGDTGILSEWSFDNQSFSVSTTSSNGVYKVRWPTSWGYLGIEDILVTSFGVTQENTPARVTLISIANYTHSFQVVVADDDTPNKGAFMWHIIKPN